MPATDIGSRLKLSACAMLALLLIGFVSAGAHSPPPPPGPEIFRDADLALGRQLIAQHQCAQCHARKVGGDGSAIYRPQGRVGTAGQLRGMVEQCNTELNLGLFPEEVTAVAAVLNQQHYRFKQ